MLLLRQWPRSGHSSLWFRHEARQFCWIITGWGNQRERRSTVMKGHGTKFERKMDEAIAALLTQRNMEDAAKLVGISPSTLLSWMKQPAFQAAYRTARRAAFGQCISRWQQAAGAAVTTLLKVMVDPNSPASTRVRAADSVLGHAAKAIEIEDIEVRLAALEQSVANDQAGRI